MTSKTLEWTRRQAFTSSPYVASDVARRRRAHAASASRSGRMTLTVLLMTLTNMRSTKPCVQRNFGMDAIWIKDTICIDQWM